MTTPIEILTAKFQSAITQAFPELTSPEEFLEVVQSSNDKFGHYQCNSAMKLAKQLQKNPRTVAEAILSKLEKTDEKTPFIEKMEIAGPGFINITLDPLFITKATQEILDKPHLGIPLPEKPLKVVVDLSSPNIAKEMHVGHLRSTIIGDCIARLFEFLGHNVLRLNHVGDWGTSFGMLIAYMKETVPEVLSGKQETDLSHLVKWYKESRKKFVDDADFKRTAQLEVVKLQSEDPISIKGWKIICAISEKAFQEIYNLLDVKLITRGESFYNPYLADLVADLEKKGMIQISDGAKCIFLEGFQNRDGESLPLMIQKSDGGYNYDTTDLASLRHRVDVEKGDRLIYVVDVGQSVHFQMIFKAAELAGYYDPKKVSVTHVPFGLVLGADGKKFKTRAGDSERLIDLLYAAIEEAQKILEEKAPEIPLEERKKLAEALGIGAVKYADLSCHRTGDYQFSYERMLRFEGNTAPFLLYAYVRIEGIKRRVNADMQAVQKAAKIDLQHPSEISLGLHLAQFGETLNMMTRDLLPNRLTEYLYSLAEKFNAFFRDCRVEGTPQQNSRLLLCEATSRVFKQGIEILGLKTVDRM